MKLYGQNRLLSPGLQITATVKYEVKRHKLISTIHVLLDLRGKVTAHSTAIQHTRFIHLREPIANTARQQGSCHVTDNRWSRYRFYNLPPKSYSPSADLSPFTRYKTLGREQDKCNRTSRFHHDIYPQQTNNNPSPTIPSTQPLIHFTDLIFECVSKLRAYSIEQMA